MQDPTTSLHDRLESLIARSSLPEGTGVLVLAAAAAALNRRQDLADSIRFGLARAVPPEHLYEVFLQLYLFAGFPAALEALVIFRTVLDSTGRPFEPGEAEAYDIDEFRRRGEHLCRRIYTTAYDKMRDRVGRLSPDLDQWMVVEGYGKTLSRPGLDVVARELAVVAVLGVLGWRNQLYSHIRGAVNAGADRADCEAVLRLAQEAFSAPALAEAFDTLHSVFA